MAAQDLLTTLKATLNLHLTDGGPGAAFSVCADTAQVLTESIAQRHRLGIRRVSMRWRNALDAPDEYEAGVLQEFSRLLDSGELTDSTEHSATVTEGGARVFRYLRPIRIQKPCLSCHGRTLAPGISEMLLQYYPDDRATGYAPGQLRGAVSIRLETE